eukprot:gene10197-25216_t
MSSTATATLCKLPIKVLKARVATHGITAPAGHQGMKDTWIAAIQQAEGNGDGWKPDVYDTTTKVWSEIGDGGMSQRLYGSASAVHNGKLYVIGGRTGMYMKMATARSSHGVAVCKDKLYVVGGKDAEGTVLDSVEVYDFASEAWGILPVPMPQARTSINNAVVQHKGKVYVVGGLGWRGEYLQRVAVYDIAAEEWSVLPAEMMENRRAHAAAVHGNQIYLLGGVGYTTLRSVEVYDIAAGEWSMISVEMQVARSAFAAAVHGDNLYTIGGMSVEAQHAMEVVADFATPENITSLEDIKSLAPETALDVTHLPEHPIRGISVWDFDDTLATTKSNVLYTMPDGTKGKINATEFALDSDKLSEAGAKFDFSEFEKVMKGKKGPIPFPSSCTALPAPTPSPRTCSSRSSGCCSELPSSNQL